jgi:hypothetical protein
MLVFEPVCKGKEHIPFNSVVLTKLLEEYPNDIIFFSEENHWLNLKKQLSPKEIARIRHTALSPCNRKTQPKEWLIQLYVIYLIYKNKKKNNKILFLSVTVPIYWWLCFFRFKKNTTVFFHSVLKESEAWASRNPFLRLLSLRMTFKLFYNRLPKTVVLETHIKRNLIHYFPNIEGHVSVIFHPLPSDKPPAKCKLNTEVKVVTFLGNFAESKGALEFYSLAKYLNIKNIELKVAGRNVTGINLGELQSTFKEGPYSTYLNRDEFTRSIIQSDFIFLHQNPDQYKWTASGVLLDIINFGVPIISRFPLDSIIQEGRFKNIGYYYSNKSELLAIFKKLTSNKHESDYAEFQHNLKMLKEIRIEKFESSFKI